jgi:exonuclease III
MIPPLTTKITGTNNHLSLISLNINELNSQIRHKLTDWIRKQDPEFCCIQKKHLSDKGRNYLRVKDWKTIFQANGPKKQAGIAIPISNKIISRAGRMAQWVRAWTAFPTVLSSNPSNCMVAHNHP